MSGLPTKGKRSASLTNKRKLDQSEKGKSSMTGHPSRRFKRFKKEPQLAETHDNQNKQQRKALPLQENDSSDTDDFTFPEDVKSKGDMSTEHHEAATVQLTGAKPSLLIGCPNCMFKSKDKGEVIEHFRKKHPRLTPPVAYRITILANDDDQYPNSKAGKSKDDGDDKYRRKSRTSDSIRQGNPSTEQAANSVDCEPHTNSGDSLPLRKRATSLKKVGNKAETTIR